MMKRLQLKKGGGKDRNMFGLACLILLFALLKTFLFIGYSFNVLFG